MDVLNELKQERDRIDAAIRALNGTRGGKLGNGRGRGERVGRPPATVNVDPQGQGKPRRMSAAARKRISDAAKARWAKAKKAGRTSLAK